MQPPEEQSRAGVRTADEEARADVDSKGHNEGTARSLNVATERGGGVIGRAKGNAA